MRTPEELFSAAEAKASTMAAPAPPYDAALERLRADLLEFFDQLPEPPVYHRVDDPVRQRAEALAHKGELLLARTMRLQREDPSVGPLLRALKAHLATLCHTTAGRIEAAETAWRDALEAQRDASAATRVWRRSDEALPPIYDRASGASRYDPRPEPTVTVKLACPNPGCQTTGPFAFSPRHATHRFRCESCQRHFVAYFAESTDLSVEKISGNSRHHTFHVQELTGQRTKIEFEDTSGAQLSVAKRDLLGFLYSDERELKGVLNLTSSRLLWVQRGGPCFVATVAFGEGAAELSTLRAFRDEILRQNALGSALVRSYYRHGPKAASWLARHPLCKGVVRRGLLHVERLLRQRGHRT